MLALYDHQEAETNNIITFFFKPERMLEFIAGQFIELNIPTLPSGPTNRRWFTLSSSPTEETISITTKFNTDDISLYKRHIANLKVGDKVNISQAMGDFVMPKLSGTPLIFIAGGIGITPFISMLKWLKATGEVRPIKFIYAVKNEDDIAFQDVFKSLNLHITIVVSQPSDAWGGEQGHLSAELILGLEQPSKDTLIYISGPAPLVENLSKNIAIKANVTKQQIITDFFPGYQDI